MGRFVAVSLAVLLSGCFVDRGGVTGDLDGGTPAERDGAAPDASAPDAARPDAAPPDGGRDAAPGDAGSDAGDAGTDAGCPDAGAPPALTVWARPTPGVTLDGELGDWDLSDAVAIAAPGDFVGSGSPTAADLSARLSVRWRSDALFVAVEVTDDVHHGGDAGGLLWRGDSVQLAFDVADDDGPAYDAEDDWEYGYTLSDAGPVERWRWVQPLLSPTATDTAAITRGGGVTRYEIRLSPGDLGLTAFAEGLSMGFSWMVNENDSGGSSREGFIEWSSGVGAGKNPSLFGTLVLRGPLCPDDSSG